MERTNIRGGIGCLRRRGRNEEISAFIEVQAALILSFGDFLCYICCFNVKNRDSGVVGELQSSGTFRGDLLLEKRDGYFIIF